MQNKRRRNVRHIEIRYRGAGSVSETPTISLYFSHQVCNKIANQPVPVIIELYFFDLFKCHQKQMPDTETLETCLCNTSFIYQILVQYP